MTQQTRYIFIVLLLSIFSFASNSNAKSLKPDSDNPEMVICESKWMSLLPDTIPVCKISIPGTHDSGSTKGGPMLKTQTQSINKQLQKGIRAFDIRLKKKNNKLGIYHSHAFQEIYWETDVLPAFITFLKENPSETLVVSLKKEGGNLEDYSDLLSISLTNDIYKEYFIDDFDPALTLKDARGKILFLHRDYVMENYPGATCTGWKDNATCILTLLCKSGTEGYAFLQDNYQYKSGKEANIKLEKCISNLNYIANDSIETNMWGVSFISATGLPKGTPIVFAKKLNKPVADYIRNKNFNWGIVFIDFAESKDGKDLIENLIKSNFNRYEI